MKLFQTLVLLINGQKMYLLLIITNIEDSSDIDHDSYFKPSKVQIMMVCDEVISRSNVICKMSLAANDIYNEFYNKKASECRYY